MVVCPTCFGRMCSTCPQTLLQVNDDLMRDRLVVGLHDDEVRHKLLAETKLTLETTVKLCRAEEAARQTGQHIAPATASVNATRSTYKRKQFTKPASSTVAQGKPNTKPSVKWNNCGCSAHTKSPCPATGKKCDGCLGIGHFQGMCPKSRKPGTNGTIGQLRLQQAIRQPHRLTPVEIILNTEIHAPVLD